MQGGCLMTDIILNEKSCAEYALDNLSLGEKPVETLGRVARYYYSVGYKKKEIGSLLEDFMLKCDPTVNIVKWQGTIDKQVNNADKYELVELSGIEITQDEMDKIQQLNGKLLQRLMFTMLCLAKYGNAVNSKNNNWVNKKDKEIFSLANISITTKRQSFMINDLWTMQYIGFSRVVDNININVKIINDSSPTVLYISDFRNLGNQYMKYCGEKYIECVCCGKVVKENHGKQQYCNDCAVEINRQKTLERYYKSQTL